MTRKDYVLISGALKDARNSLGRFASPQEINLFHQACFSIASALKEENERFDRERFMTACGLDKDFI